MADTPGADILVDRAVDIPAADGADIPVEDGRVGDILVEDGAVADTQVGRLRGSNAAAAFLTSARQFAA